MSTYTADPLPLNSCFYSSPKLTNCNKFVSSGKEAKTRSHLYPVRDDEAL